MKNGAFDYLIKPFSAEQIERHAQEGRGLHPARQGQPLPQPGKTRTAGYELLGQSPAMDEPAPAHPQGRPHPGHRPDPGRKRHRQGTRRPRPLPRKPPRQRPLHQGQLRRHPGKPHRKRILRPRKGRLHRRAQQARGPLRTGPRRHHPARRNQRDLPAGPGQAAARAPGTRARARRRQPHHQGGRPRHRHHQPPPRDTASRRRNSARTSISASTSSPSPCRRCANAREDVPLLAEDFMRRFARKHGVHVQGFLRRIAAASSRPTTGPATSANCRTSSNAPSSSAATAACSNPNTWASTS